MACSPSIESVSCAYYSPVIRQYPGATMRVMRRFTTARAEGEKVNHENLHTDIEHLDLDWVSMLIDAVAQGSCKRSGGLAPEGTTIADLMKQPTARLVRKSNKYLKIYQYFVLVNDVAMLIIELA